MRPPCCAHQTIGKTYGKNGLITTTTWQPSGQGGVQAHPQCQRFQLLPRHQEILHGNSNLHSLECAPRLVHGVSQPEGYSTCLHVPICQCHWKYLQLTQWDQCFACSTHGRFFIWHHHRSSSVHEDFTPSCSPALGRAAHMDVFHMQTSLTLCTNLDYIRYELTPLF